MPRIPKNQSFVAGKRGATKSQIKWLPKALFKAPDQRRHSLGLTDMANQFDQVIESSYTIYRLAPTNLIAWARDVVD